MTNKKKHNWKEVVLKGHSYQFVLDRLLDSIIYLVKKTFQL